MYLQGDASDAATTGHKLKGEWLQRAANVTLGGEELLPTCSWSGHETIGSDIANRGCDVA